MAVPSKRQFYTRITNPDQKNLRANPETRNLEPDYLETLNRKLLSSSSGSHRLPRSRQLRIWTRALCRTGSVRSSTTATRSGRRTWSTTAITTATTIATTTATRWIRSSVREPRSSTWRPRMRSGAGRSPMTRFQYPHLNSSAPYTKRFVITSSNYLT